ncbi:MAG: NAD(P)-binding domain-containing protein [Marinifilaceae bacterium]|jgi:D-3-phosphoglycerate dehydrogenase|nr:NAD(P)-binding domain-containing protein [Marinifilaceae bacterium]
MRVLFVDTTHICLEEMLEKHGFEIIKGYNLSIEECKNLLTEVDGLIIRSRFPLTKVELSTAKQLRFIGRVGAGLENIDIDFAESQNIICYNAPEGNRDAVGEHAIGMLLSVANNLVRCNSEVSQGIWKREENRGWEIKTKTVGIIGYGNMGGEFAKRLSGFGCNVIAYDKYKSDYTDQYCKEVSLDDLFEQADILSLHIPQNEETMFMVDAQFILNFKKPIVIINTARGKIVKTSALVENLKKGKVKAACLDVLEYEKASFEKLHAENLPDDFRYLIEADNVILSPHVGGWTHESNIKLAQVIAEKIIKDF